MATSVAFDPNLLDALEASQVEQVKGTVWRQILDPTSVTRPNQRGGRWNRSGTEALYCALGPDTAAAEIEHLISSQPVPITRQRRTYNIEVRLSKVVDLRPDPWAQPFTYPYDPDDIEQCQHIGAAVSWLECGGLIVPSLRHHGANLVIYVANLGHDDVLEPTNDSHPHPPGPPADIESAALEPADRPSTPPG